jgi:CheY-like chemotaxis protein|tara:strand:+ start:239 stop:634 length:396 start_codon:yes stop_codon:yes gene_type:complete
MQAQSKKKILLVDDEKEVITFLSNTLERHGYEIVTASCGSEAIEVAKEARPDLIILDIIMPDIYGADVAKTLGQDLLTRDIPIVFLTGIAGKEEESLGIKAGKQYEMLAKPVDEAKLLAVIEEFSRLTPPS